MLRIVNKLVKLLAEGRFDFGHPGKHNIVVYDSLTGGLLTKMLDFPKRTFQMNVRQEIIYAHPYILAKFLLKAIVFRKQLRVAYEASVLELLCPKLVLTFLDNDGTFGEVAKQVDARFIAIQNGFRTSQCFSRINFAPEAFLFGQRCIDNYAKFEIESNSLIRAGSIKVSHCYKINGNSFKRSKSFDVLLVSSYQLGMENGASEDQEPIRLNLNKGTALISDYLLRFISSRGLRVGILLWGSGADGARELKYFSRIFRDKVEYIEKSQAIEGSYLRVLESELTLSYGSTLGYEAISMGKKAMFFPRPEEDVYCLEGADHFAFKTETGSYEEFESNLERLLKLSSEEYQNELGWLCEYVVAKRVDLVDRVNEIISKYS